MFKEGSFGDGLSLGLGLGTLFGASLILLIFYTSTYVVTTDEAVEANAGCYYVDEDFNKRFRWGDCDEAE